MKKLSIIVLFIALFAVGCEKWDHKIAAVEDRLELLEGTTIPNIEQQIVNINASIDDLKAVDEALQGLIDNLEAKAEDLQAQLDANAAADAATKAALESEIANLKALIAALQAKDVELDQKIADLQKYVDDEISATEDWANQTFSTLEQYADMQQEISALKALLEQYKSEITDAYTNAIKTAINASEASMKDWVNKTLAEGYYTKAEIDGKITALQTQVTEGDAALQKEIDALKAALEKAEGDLTVAYVEAIEKAINDNNGKISAEIAAAVKTAQDNLQAQIDAINNEIEKIKSRLDNIEAEINSINGQITAITSSIDDLKLVDAELKAYIEALQTTAANLQSQIDATEAEIENVKKEMGDTIDAVEQSLLNKLDNLKASFEGELAAIKADIETLKAKDVELEGRIAALETYVDTQLQATEDWANATFATLAQYEEIQGTIAGIKSDIAAINTAIANLETKINEKIATDIKTAIDALRTELGADYAAKIEDATNNITAAYTAAIETAKDDIEAAYTKAIADAIAASEAAMKNWVNGELQKVYSDISALRIELEALAASAATDEELAAAVTAQQAALEQAKKDLTTAYEAAIKKAIDDNNGVIDDAIAAAITAATTNLQNEIANIKSEIDSIKSRLEALEKSFANRIQSLKYLPEYNDGKVTMDYTARTLNLDFIISPAEVATLLKQQFDADNSVIKAYVRYTKTRAAGDIVEQKVSAMSVGENGIFTLTIEGQNLSNDFWTGVLDAVIYIQIIDQNGNNVVSDMIPMEADEIISQQLAMPTNVRAEQISRGVMRISWDPVPNADFYEFCEGNPNVGIYLPTDNCYYDFEYTEEAVGATQQFGIKAASNSLLYTTSEAYKSMSGVAYPELLSEVSIEYEATEQLTLTEGTFGDATYTHTFADGKGTITFDSSVTEYSIANNAFRETPALTSITFSEGLTTIGSNAFYSCAALEKVVIKGDVTAIGQNAFASCSSLSTVEYYGTTELTTSNAFFDTTLLFVSVTDAYPSAVFCGIMARKEL